jgi:hypothetical protein
MANSPKGVSGVGGDQSEMCDDDWFFVELCVTLRVSNPHDYVNHMFKRP